MSVILVAKTSVLHYGVIIPPGEEFACDLSHAKKLISGGSAEMKDLKQAKNGQKSGENDENPMDPTFELIAKLNEINVPLLKDLAKKHDIELDSDDKKPQIVKKLVEAGVKLDEEDV